jgi:hypothetical protein
MIDFIIQYKIIIHDSKIYISKINDRTLVANLRPLDERSLRSIINVSLTIMKLFYLLVLFGLITTALAAYDLDHGYTDDAAYRRRKDSERVNKKMVEYWSQPDVLATLPESMREKVHIYIKKFPQYQYKGSSGGSDESRRKGDPCITH